MTWKSNSPAIKKMAVLIVVRRGNPRARRLEAGKRVSALAELLGKHGRL